MKKVLILSASPRKDGNSDILCHPRFLRTLEMISKESSGVREYGKKVRYDQPRQWTKPTRPDSIAEKRKTKNCMVKPSYLHDFSYFLIFAE